MTQPPTSTEETEILLPPARPLIRRLYPGGPLVVMYANEGGGTRKTTGVVNTAVALGKQGINVGVACCDQTMQASTYLGYGVTNRKHYPQRTEIVYDRLKHMPNLYGVLMGECSLKDAMVPARTRVVSVTPDEDGNLIDDERWDTDACFAEIPNVSLFLGSRDMAVASEHIRNSGLPSSRSKSGLHWLRKAIQSLPPGTLDILLIDSRGTFDTLELTELGASDYVVGCVKPDTKDDDTLHGLKALIGMGHETYEFSGGSADLRYILFNGYVRNRGRFYIEIYDEFKAFYGDMLLPHVSENVQVAESVKAQEPVHYWMPGQASLIKAQFDAIGRTIARDLRQTV